MVIHRTLRVKSFHRPRTSGGTVGVQQHGTWVRVETEYREPCLFLLEHREADGKNGIDMVREVRVDKYLVKALVSKLGQSASLRFVPLEIFDLWKSHMQNTHSYEVRSLKVSLWVSSGKIGGESRRGGEMPHESVVCVTLHKKVGAVEIPVERYFPEEEVDRILPRFLAHYGIDSPDQTGAARIQILRGSFLQPEDVFDDEV